MDEFPCYARRAFDVVVVVFSRHSALQLHKPAIPIELLNLSIINPTHNLQTILLGIHTQPASQPIDSHLCIMADVLDIDNAEDFEVDDDGDRE